MMEKDEYKFQLSLEGSQIKITEENFGEVHAEEKCVLDDGYGRAKFQILIPKQFKLNFLSNSSGFLLVEEDPEGSSITESPEYSDRWFPPREIIQASHIEAKNKIQITLEEEEPSDTVNRFSGSFTFKFSYVT